MIVPENFYESEVRDGYFVPSEMKRCWAATIEVLCEIDRICRKHNLRYFADYGTMIGAVRHGGFIPWDDDLDICMPRPDYMEFIKAAKSELPKDYDCLSFYTHYKYNNSLCRVVNNTFICLEQEFLENNHDFPFAVGVDIFPIDYVKIEKDENETQRGIIADIIRNITDIHEDEMKLTNLGEKGMKLAQICANVGYIIREDMPIRQQMYILADNLMSLYEEPESEMMAHMYFWALYNNHIYPKKVYENYIRVPFEYISIPVPVGYDEILLTDYGNNYMTPIKSGGMHEYPVYTPQKNVMFETLNRYYYDEYVFDRKDLEKPTIAKVSRNSREVVFLPFSAKHWKSMEPQWTKEMDTEGTDVYVIPVPYYKKGNMRLDETLCYDGDKFPDYVQITGFDVYDFEARRPDRIYINNADDNYNEGLSVHPRFYSSMMGNVTDDLVYIPYFDVDDFDESVEKSYGMAKFYINKPGVVRADRVILNSEVLRRVYVDILTEFAGDDTRSIWEKKIIFDGTKTEAEPVGLFEDEVPENWWSYLMDENGEGKKVILYHTSVSTIVQYKEKYIEKIEKVLKLFKDNSDKLTVLWHEGYDTRRILREDYPDVWEQYVAVVNKYKQDNYGIFEDGEDCYKSVAIADAYYGDRDPVLYMAKSMNKPVMIQSVEM